MKRVWMAVIALGSLAICTKVEAQTRPTLTPRAAATVDTALRIVISVEARRLWVVSGASDTLLAAPVAVGSGKTLRAAGQTWVFNTPRGVHTVLSKEENPIWVRPEWSYVEVARRYGLRLARIERGKRVVLEDGSVLEIRGGSIGLSGDAGVFAPLPIDEEIVFDGVLYVPPIEAENRRVPGQLGRYRLKLGDGIGLHGTPDSASVGQAVTHGCLRLHDADLEWLYRAIAIGTRVYIY